MAKVFISHSWNDNDIARKIYNNLKYDGAETWIDYVELRPGEELPKRISQALEWCDTLVVIWSKSATDSYYVGLEWQAALDMQKKIILCLVDNAKRPAILRGFLYIDFKNFSKGYEQLLGALDLEVVKPPVSPRPRIKIPTQKIMKITAIFLAIVMLGLTANYVVQKIASARKAYWQKRQTEMTNRFEQAQRSNGDTQKSASDKHQIWQQFLTEFAADNPFSQQDDTQRQEAIKQRDRWNNQAKQDAEKARWAQFQNEMNLSYQQALRRDNLASLNAADKANMWQDFLNQYAEDNPFSQEDNDQCVKAARRKDFWLTQVEQEKEQARWQQRQIAMTKDFNEAKQRDQNNSVSPTTKLQTWQNFLTSYADDNPFSQQDNEQRKYANERKTYWTNYKLPEPKPVAPPQQKTINGMTLILIRGGTFEMGDTFGDGDADEKPVHSVTVSDFYLSTTEVTNAQYAAFLNAYGKDKDDLGNTMIYEHDWGVKKSGNRWQPQPGYENYPVVYVTWYGAAQYAKWAGCRLPTEAEWEHAAREGGKKIKWSGTNNQNSLREYAWYDSNSGNKTHPIGTKKPNTLGLYDMSGNVWEWCSDWYDSDYYKNSPRNNPTGPASGTAHVLRGGSWVDYPWLCRSAHRGRCVPGDGDGSMGFRVVQDSPQ